MPETTLTDLFYPKLMRITKLGGPIAVFHTQKGRVYGFIYDSEDVRLESQMFEGAELTFSDKLALMKTLAESAAEKGLGYPPYNENMLEDIEYWIDSYIEALEDKIRMHNPVYEGEIPKIIVQVVNLQETVFDYTASYGDTKFEARVAGNLLGAHAHAKARIMEFAQEAAYLT